jgi:hypothetical protein
MLVEKELQPFFTEKSLINVKTCGMWATIFAIALFGRAFSAL